MQTQSITKVMEEKAIKNQSKVKWLIRGLFFLAGVITAFNA